MLGGDGDLIEQGAVVVSGQQAAERFQRRLVFLIQRTRLGVGGDEERSNLIDERIERGGVGFQSIGVGLITGHRDPRQALIRGPQLLQHTDGRGGAGDDRLHLGIGKLLVKTGNRQQLFGFRQRESGKVQDSPTKPAVFSIGTQVFTDCHWLFQCCHDRRLNLGHGQSPYHTSSFSGTPLTFIRLSLPPAPPAVVLRMHRFPLRSRRGASTERLPMQQSRRRALRFQTSPKGHST